MIGRRLSRRLFVVFTQSRFTLSRDLSVTPDDRKLCRQQPIGSHLPTAAGPAWVQVLLQVNG